MQPRPIERSNRGSFYFFNFAPCPSSSQHHVSKRVLIFGIGVIGLALGETLMTRYLSRRPNTGAYLFASRHGYYTKRSRILRVPGPSCCPAPTNVLFPVPPHHRLPEYVRNTDIVIRCLNPASTPNFTTIPYQPRLEVIFP